jgi:hypothetical protein
MAKPVHRKGREGRQGNNAENSHSPLRSLRPLRFVLVLIANSYLPTDIWWLL